MPVSVSFKPSALSYSDLFQLMAVVRYPRSSRPVASWIIRESLCIASFSPMRPALLVAPTLLFAWSAYVVARLRWAYRVNRVADACIVELSEDGVCIRNRDTEWRTRWKAGFEIAVASRFVLINCGKATKVWIPRQSFQQPARGVGPRVGRVQG